MDPKTNSISFLLPLDDDSFYSCGTSKLRNKLTGTKVFYHRIIIEERIPENKEDKRTGLKRSSSSHHQDRRDQLNNRLKDDEDSSSESLDGGNWAQEAVTVKCIIPGDTSLHPRLKRQIFGHDLPDNFTESSEELIDYSGNVTARAPLPLLNIAVKQNGEFVDTALNVSPGTPLEMIIYLDEVSANVYGLLTSFLRVTDNTPKKQEEIIILNGYGMKRVSFLLFILLFSFLTSVHFFSNGFKRQHVLHHLLFLSSKF